MKSTVLKFLFLVFLPDILFAQKIDNMSSIRDIKSDSYFRFNYDNDYFSATDKNYTQGYSFELATPNFSKNPLNKLFYKPENLELKYGLCIEHIGFTPKYIASNKIQFDDRPFAAAIMLKSFLITTDSTRKYRFISSLNIGLIGPGAFGKEMQVAIHRATENTTPEGWHNQIKNDLVLNYELGFEKQLFRYRNLFSLQTNSTVRVGTLFSNLSSGINATFGIINSPFTSVSNPNKFCIYLYSQPIVNAIGYDASLQGGMFNNRSPYTISTTAIQRFTFQHNYGLVVQTKSMYFEYSRATITNEFQLGNFAKWGGIKIGFQF
jgi:lipid A 3-O-deacylase